MPASPARLSQEKRTVLPASWRRVASPTGDGHISADGRFDELDLKTGDGRVDVRAGAGSKLEGEWR
ncbi:MAG TPA: hypothetical protein VGU90_07935, partial [Terriglobales bacterium]|nr:hypothetical protein [Terriglobales bacterium]